MSGNNRDTSVEVLNVNNCSVLAIVGSRSFADFGSAEDRVAFVGQCVVDAGWSVSEVVSGGADGVDTAGARWARQAGVPVTEIEPDWARHGKAAGMIRNSDIIRAADVCLAIWDGESNGTRDSIGKARQTLGDDNVCLVGFDGARPVLENVRARSL